METEVPVERFTGDCVDPAVGKQAYVFDLYVLWWSYTPDKGEGCKPML
jgi:hypothetical protein